MSLGNPMQHPIQAGVDLGIFGIIVASLMSVVPPIAAILGLLYYAIQVYESKTVQHWLLDRRQKHAARRLRKLEARRKVIVAEIEAAELVRSASAAAMEQVAVAKAEALKTVVENNSHKLPSPLHPLG